MRIVHVKSMSDDFEVCMTENDAKKFVEGFPKNSFTIVPIQVRSFDNVIMMWDSFIENID